MRRCNVRNIMLIQQLSCSTMVQEKNSECLLIKSNRVFSCRQLSKSNIQKHTKILSICIVSIRLNTKTQLERVTISYLCNLRQKPSDVRQKVSDAHKKTSDAHHKSSDAKFILRTDKTLSYKMCGVRSIHSITLQFLPPHYGLAYYFMVDEE